MLTGASELSDDGGVAPQTEKPRGLATLEGLGWEGGVLSGIQQDRLVLLEPSS